jgi:hypothetical protein
MALSLRSSGDLPLCPFPHGLRCVSPFVLPSAVWSLGYGSILRLAHLGFLSKSKDTIAPGNDPNPPKDKEH